MRRMLFGAVCALAVQAVSATAQVPRRASLFKDARGELAAARARGETNVLVVIASMRGANARVARTITELGGTVRFRDDDVDYLRARLPLESVEKLAGDPSVHGLDISISGTSRSFGNPAAAQSAVGQVERGSNAGPAVAADTVKRAWPPVPGPYPLTNRYDPIEDLGGLGFRKTNPTFDGRGTTIAIIDLNLDPLLPELQAAITLDGKPARKIVAYETVIDAEDEPDGRWLRMNDTVRASASASFSYRGRTYAAPRAGLFRIALLDEAVVDTMSRADIERDLNRDGNPAQSSRLFAVIWDEKSNEVWVDTDQDLSFTNEKALGDFRTRPEFGVFGADRPETAVRESIGFGVQIDAPKKMIAINAGIAAHATLVIGAAAASRGALGRFDGVAPGAQIANIAQGGAAYGQTEAVIRAMKNPQIDVVFLEQSSLITRTYLPRDGRLVATVIYSRLMEKYRKPLLVPTHNYPILGGIDDLVLAHGAIGVGGHESKENFLINHGVRVKHDDNLLITGGYGPMGDGALKPDVIAPSNFVSTGRGFVEGTAMPGLFQLPPGYNIAGGTSTATPTAAAAVAVLISAARQNAVKHDAFRIKHALTMSARWVPHLPAYKQGNGVVNIAGAWEILKALDQVDTLISITAQAPVKHAWSHTLASPGEGAGIYERDGWAAGDRAERVITLTRTTGPREPMTFAVSWTGNEANTFMAPATVTLALNQPTQLVVTISPRQAGVHSALLTLDHASVPGHAFRMLNTIVAAETFSASNRYTVERAIEVPRPGLASVFYRVPEGVQALRIDLDAPRRPVGLTVVRPDTRAETGTRTVPERTGKVTYMVNDPMPGLWEVRLTDVDDTRAVDWQQVRKLEPVPPTPATLTVSTLAIDVTTAPGSLALARASENNDGAGQDLSFRNRMAAFTGAAGALAMGSAHRNSVTIRAGEQLVFDVNVLPGSTALIARALRPSDPGADLDVYLYDCTKECRSARADADFTGDEHVVIENPNPGRWKIVVDAVRVPWGSTTFEYLDVVFNPLYGMTSVADLPVEHGSGTEWQARAHAWLATPLEAGRVPFAGVRINAHGTSGERFPLVLRELK